MAPKNMLKIFLLSYITAIVVASCTLTLINAKSKIYHKCKINPNESIYKIFVYYIFYSLNPICTHKRFFVKKKCFYYKFMLKILEYFKTSKRSRLTKS